MFVRIVVSRLILKRTKEQSRAKRGKRYRKEAWDLGSLAVQRPRLVYHVSTRQVYSMSWWRIFLPLHFSSGNDSLRLSFLNEKGDIEGKQNAFRPLLRTGICRSAAWVYFAWILPARKIGYTERGRLAINTFFCCSSPAVFLLLVSIRPLAT